MPLDVDNQNGVTPLDVLIVINRLNSVGAGKLPPPVTAQLSPPFYDTSGDNEVTALDVLRVINHLNAAASNVAGEGEGVVASDGRPSRPDRADRGRTGLVDLRRGSNRRTRAATALGVNAETRRGTADDSWRVGVDRLCHLGLSEPR